jgi:hypothetical protein
MPGNLPSHYGKKAPGKGRKLVAVNRFDHNFVATGLVTPSQIFLVAERNNNNNRRGAEAWIAFNLTAANVTAHTGHLKIEKNQVRGFLFDDFQGLLAAACHQEAKTFPAKEGFFQPPNEFSTIGK